MNSGNVPLKDAAKPQSVEDFAQCTIEGSSRLEILEKPSQAWLIPKTESAPSMVARRLGLQKAFANCITDDLKQMETHLEVLTQRLLTLKMTKMNDCVNALTKCIPKGCLAQ